MLQYSICKDAKMVPSRVHIPNCPALLLILSLLLIPGQEEENVVVSSAYLYVKVAPESYSWHITDEMHINDPQPADYPPATKRSWSLVHNIMCC